jgi:methionine synthase II (cobalamin-independent)
LSVPRTTTIGSYPSFPKAEDVEYYQKMEGHGLKGELVDPFVWSTEEAVKDFAAAGVELVSTGQTRGDLYSLFLDPNLLDGVEWKGSEAFVTGKLKRRADMRVKDVRVARELLPAHFQIKEPITDAYTLAKFAKVTGRSYRTVADLAKDVNRKIVIPEIEALQEDGAVSMIQLDSPSLAAESSLPSYIADLYEEASGAAKVPLVLHACGDTSRILGFLSKLKVKSLLLDFYHFPKLFDEAARRSYDQTLGLGVLDSQQPRVEAVEEVRGVIAHGERLLKDRIEFVHPHCGERSIDRASAYAKNSNMTLARDDVYFGEAEEARGRSLGRREYDPRGYFLVAVKRETHEIVVSFYTYAHKAVKRFRSRRAEAVLQAINDDADKLGISRRHLAYLTLELGRAEASLGSPSATYRQQVLE